MKDQRPRLLSRLEVAGNTGCTKTELSHFMQIGSDHLNLLLRELIDRFEVIGVRMPKKHGFGRPAYRFWHKEFAPKDLGVLTPAAPGDIPVLEPGEPPPTGGTCCRCGRPTPIVLDGQPLRFCSDACRESEGLTLLSIAEHMTSPADWGKLARLFVLLDLTVRGFKVGFDPFEPTGQLLVYDLAGAIAVLSVLPIAQSGHFPPLDDYNSVALVYRDGRVQYAGKNPLVENSQKTENVDHG